MLNTCLEYERDGNRKVFENRKLRKSAKRKHLYLMYQLCIIFFGEREKSFSLKFLFVYFSGRSKLLPTKYFPILSNLGNEFFFFSFT